MHQTEELGKEVRETDKIDQTMEAICDHIQRLIQANQTKEAAKLTKALAALVTARGNLKIADFKVCEEHDYQYGAKIRQRNKERKAATI